MRGSAALLATAVALVARTSSAQVTAEAELSASVVEINQPFTLTFSVMVDEATPMPRNPTLVAPAGLTLRGPSVGTKQQVSIAGGRVETRRGINATWTLVAAKPGTYTIGPPRAELGSRTVNGQPRAVQVVPAGKGPRSSARPGLDPFDVFRGLPGFGLPGFGRGADLDEFEDLPAGPEELRLERAPDPTAFLRAEVEPRRVVVGEQVTLRLYAYGSRGPFREVNSSEPTRADFLSFPILESSATERLERVTIDGTVWFATRVREVALFPLRSGPLLIGSFQMGFGGRGYPAASPHLGLVRQSPTITLDVTEPPAHGRPPGYRLGDVGQFSLNAKVEPRSVQQGEAVSVIATLEGTGNLPHRLDVPSQRGVEWLEPTINDEIGNRGSRVGGWRKFGFVVRLDAAGVVDLGEITLPYWDPSRDAYDTARAILGTVEVKATAGATVAGAPAREDALAPLATPRGTLGEAPSSPRRWADHAWFWLVLGGAPSSVVVGGSSLHAVRRLRERWRTRKASARSLALSALGEARKADDAARAAGHLERAVHLALDDALGVRARAVLRGDLEAHLAERGLAPKEAESVRALLDDCDAVRFTGASHDAAALVRRTADLLRSLDGSRARSRT